jgi:hypothetical protein
MDANALDADLRQRTWKLLQPGEIALDGLVVHTELDSSRETFVYSGTDSSEFASNQHQGLTLDDESFVWECQQLLRDGTFDIVFYFEAEADVRAVLADVREAGHEATGVRGDADSPAAAAIE